MSVETIAGLVRARFEKVRAGLDVGFPDGSAGVLLQSVRGGVWRSVPATALAFDDNQFDVVILEPSAVTQPLVREAHRVLRGAGCLFFSFEPRDARHSEGLDLPSVYRLVRSGFDIVDVKRPPWWMFGFGDRSVTVCARKKAWKEHRGLSCGPGLSPFVSSCLALAAQFVLAATPMPDLKTAKPDELNAWGTSALEAALSSATAVPDTNAVARAVACFRRATELGDARGMYNMGMCYQGGCGVACDPALAFVAFKSAAEKGLPEAINNVGGVYRDGSPFLARDLVEAARWFRKSAELGNDFGQLNWALALLRGEGVPRNESEAVRLLRLSAAQGNDIAMEFLAGCYEHGSGVKKDAEQGLVWRIRARAARGDGPASKWLRVRGLSEGAPES